MFKAIRHFITITHHRHLVLIYCFRSGLYKQGLLHDLSKYSFSEFIPSVKNYAYGKYSPNTNERTKKGYSSAWLHHKGRNKHHSEYWFDYNQNLKRYAPVKMPNRYVAESVCDRIAASKNYNKKNFKPQMALDYLINEKDRIVMHPETYEKVHYLLTMYVEKGEKYLFKYIKKNLRNNLS